MFEEMTYENIKENLKKSIKVIDTREGSVVDLIVSPIAIEIEGIYKNLEKLLSIVFIDESTGIYLDKHANELDIYRNIGSKATGEVTFIGASNTMIRKGTLVTTASKLLYETTEDVTISAESTTVNAKIIASDIGTKYNVEQNSINIMPISVYGVTSVTNQSALFNGEDYEDDNRLILKIKDAISKSAADGNVNQYLKWVDEFVGIGRAKVFPIWEGANTVKISITDASYKVASAEVVSAFQEFLDPGSKGLGNGKAPIGAKVTVKSGLKKDINIALEVKLATGYIQPDGLTQAITDYLSEITYVKNSISYMQLGSAILNLPSISDVRNMYINDTQSDIILEEEDIPILNNLNTVVI